MTIKRDEIRFYWMYFGDVKISTTKATKVLNTLVDLILKTLC